jgi:hypothetical protein
MLHQIKLPSSTNDNLQCVLDFMERLLAFSVAHKPIEIKDLENEFGADVTKWLIDNDVRVLEKLREFTNTKTDTERQVALDAFRHDREFAAHITDSAFLFQLRLSNKDALHTWLKKFYDQLGASGFHSLVSKDHSGDYHKDRWWTLFIKENPNQSMCITCDGMMIDKRSIEHYLPRSLYPALSIHPNNLVPMCQKCNGGKESDDPLNGRNLTEIFFPYRDAIDQLVDLEFSSTSKERETIIIKPIGNAPELTAQITHYANAYQIPKRWNDGYEDITKLAWGRLKDRMNILHDEGIQVDKDRFLAAIEKTTQQMEKDWGNFPYAYPASKWLRWAKEHKFESLCQEFEIPFHQNTNTGFLGRLKAINHVIFDFIKKYFPTLVKK